MHKDCPFQEGNLMNSESMEYISIDINRRPIYIIGVVMTVSGSVFMFFLTTSFGAELWEVLLFSIAMPSLLIVGAVLASLITPLEIGIGTEGIQLVFKLGRRLDIGWKDVISLQPYRAPDFYHLKYHRKGGVIRMCTVSGEAANKIRHVWSNMTGYDLPQ